MRFNRTDGTLLDLLQSRRSTLARNIDFPGATREQLLRILTVGARVPDHGKLAPWRFVVFENESRAALSQNIADSIESENPETSNMTVRSLRSFADRAPTVIAVVSTPNFDCKIPVWEQQLSAGAVCQNMLLAAASLNLAAQWLTGPGAYSPGVNRFLGVADSDRVAGFIFLGSHPETPLKERPRPDLNDLVDWR